MRRPGISDIAWAAAAAFLAVNVAFLVLRVSFDLFDPDELQHAHIAWMVAGGKVLYRDFWEHHGPFFGLLNGLLLRAWAPPPGADLIVWCRAGSALAAAGIVALTWRLARIAGLPAVTALTAAALLAALVFVQDKGSECRPDTWQNLFWIAGLCVVAAAAGRRSAGALAAGALFGLAVMTNTKAAIGPCVLLLYYLCGGRLHRLALRDVARELAALAAGAALVYLGFLAYFLDEGAAREFNVFNTVWNLIAAAKEAGRGRGWDYAVFMLQHQLPFVLAAAGGLAFWIADLRRPAGELARPAAALLAVVALGTGATWGLSNYPQFFLMFLPLWAVIAAFGVQRVAAGLRQRAGTAAAAGLLLAGAAAMIFTATSWSLTREHPLLRFQKAFTAALVSGTARSEPMGVLWDTCGGFMFNEPLQYYWVAQPVIGAVVLRHTGTDPFGAPFVQALEQRHVRFVVGRDGETLAGLPRITREYLHRNFYYANCLWTRREAADG